MSIKVKGYLGSIEVVKEICGQELEGLANFVCMCSGEKSDCWMWLERSSPSLSRTSWS